MMSVAQESVKSAFCMRIPGVFRSQGIFFLIFCEINCHFGSHFVKILILFLYFSFKLSVFN